MTDREVDGTGFYLAGGELTVAGTARQAIVDGQLAEFSVTADLFGGAGMDVTPACWNTGPTGDIRTRFTTVSYYCPVVRRFVEQNLGYRDLLGLEG